MTKKELLKALLIKLNSHEKEVLLDLIVDRAESNGYYDGDLSVQFKEMLS